MLYYLIRPIARIAFRAYFRKIYISHIGRIPKNKPVVLAVNHPTAFIEPCILACFLPYKLHFLVRGDVFSSPLIKKILAGFYLIPIYRSTDGIGKMRGNTKTFEECNRILSEQKILMILPEGKTIMEKRLRPIQKGTARLIFGALEEYADLDIHLIPVGANFTDPRIFRSDVMFQIGEPIRIQEYMSVYAENKNKAVKQVTDRLKVEMEKNIIIIDKPEDEALTENLFILKRSELADPIVPNFATSNDQLLEELKMATMVNGMDEAGKSNLKKKVEAYFAKLKNANIEDTALVRSSSYNLGNTLVLLLGFIPFVLGYVTNYLPLRFGQYYGQTNIKQLEFKAPTSIAVSIFSYLPYILILAIIGSLWKGWLGLLFVVMIPVWGYFALLYMDLYKKWKASKKLRKVSVAEIDSLRKERHLVRQAIDQIA